MIGDPPVLTLRRHFERPTVAQVAAFDKVQTGFVVDAQMGQGAIDRRIKPLWPCAVVGPAVTARCGPRDNMAVWVAMKIARPGDVLALHTGGYEDAAVIGDHVAAIAKSLGVVAVVPRARIDEVIAGLEDVREKERATGERIAAGATIPDWVDELIGSSRTRLLD
jgi:4-hydroxy-4-methyl-2-oxoglutarate aldolase